MDKRIAHDSSKGKFYGFNKNPKRLNQLRQNKMYDSIETTWILRAVIVLRPNAMWNLAQKFRT